MTPRTPRKPARGQPTLPDPATIPLRKLTLESTHRLIPTRVSPDGGGTVLARLSTDPTTLGHLQELDDATNDRFRGEDGLHAGIALEELLFGSRFAHIVNAAFTHPSPLGGRFNSPNRGAWYSSLDRPTALAEFASHRLRQLEEIRWPEPEATLVDDYSASITATVYDLREPAPKAPGAAVPPRFQFLLQPGPIPACYAPSQQFAAALLAGDADGLLYPSVRHPGGSCLVLFRPALLPDARRAGRLELTLQAGHPFQPHDARELP